MKKKFDQERMKLKGDTRMLIFLHNKLGEDVEEEWVDLENAKILLDSVEEDDQHE